MNKMGELIKKLRRQRGWTQGQLGYKLSLTSSAICQIENRQTKNPKLETLAQILYELNAPPTWAFKEAGLPVRSGNPGNLVPPLVEINEIINVIPEGPKRERLESLLLKIARDWRDYDE